MINLLIAVGVFLMGCLESILVTAGVISQAKGWAKTAAVMSFLNVSVYLLTLKIAIDISFLMMVPYTLAFALGTYVTVKWSGKYKRLWRKWQKRSKRR